MRGFIKRRLSSAMRRFPMTRAATLVVDDGPSEATRLLLSRLEEAGHRAVLFVLGCNIAGREDVLADAVRRGFALGNHSFRHPYFSTIDLEDARAEIARTDALIDDVYTRAGMPRPGKWFRFPYLDIGGSRAPEFQRLLHELGFERPRRIARWLRMEDPHRLDWPTTVFTRDYKLPGETAIRKSLETIRPGDVVEFHDRVDTVALYGGTLADELTRCEVPVTLPRARERRA